MGLSGVWLDGCTVGGATRRKLAEDHSQITFA